MNEPNQKPMVYVEDGTTYYRASSLLQCPTAFIHTRNNQPQRIFPNMRRAFNEGIELEPQVINMLNERKMFVFSGQLEITLPLSTNLAIIGHIDGMCEGKVVEVKCLSDKNFELFFDDYTRHFPYYAYQLSAYMLATGSPGLFAIYNKATKELRTMNVLIPPISLEQLTTQVLSYQQAWRVYQSTDTLPACTTTTFCPFYHLHKEYTDDADDQALDLDGDVVLANAVAAYEAATSRIKILEGAQKVARAVIENALEASGSTRASGTGYSVSYSPVTSTRIDQKKVEKLMTAHSIPDDEWKTASTSKRLVVKRDV